tara:strand:- start:104 stop:826 length:723 start_codon:yes stop_codon:yes gene_type:complete
MDVSIIITSFNYEDFIEESIESCLKQKTQYEYEIIIVDDGSTDNTRNILKKYENECNVLLIDNSGVEAASNYAFKFVRSPYFLRLDADDSLKPFLVEKLFNAINGSNYDFVYSNYDNIDKDSLKIRSVSLPKFCKNEIFERGDFLATGTLFDSRLFKKYSGYNDQTKNCGLENYEFILQAINDGSKGMLIEDNLFNYRIHQSNLSSKKRSSLIEYGKVLFQSKRYGNYSTNINHPYGLVV